MPVYLINSYDITDREAFADYIPLAKSVFEKYGGEVIVADFNALALEGTFRGVHTVVKFPSAEEALSFYNDPDYQAAKNIRSRSTINNSVVLTKEWVKQV